MHKVGILLFAFLLVSASCVPARAWESDVHYGMTRWLATQAGFSDEHAKIIANGNWNVDHGIFSDPVYLVLHYACFGSSNQEGSRKARDLHFPGSISLPASPAMRRVIPDYSVVMNRVETEISGPPSNDREVQNDRLKSFGQVLHTYHDSWAHQGVPDVPPVCNSALAWGHPKDRGGWCSHEADHTHRHERDIDRIAQRTWDWMMTFLERHPWARQSQFARRSFTEQRALQAFARAKTVDEKRRWFLQNGFQADELVFLDEVTLPDPRPATTRPLPPQRNWPVPPGLPPVPNRVRDFFADFLTRWITSAKPADLKLLIQQSVDTGRLIASIDRSYPALKLSSELTSSDQQLDFLTSLFGLWLVRDHGTVAQAGHGFDREYVGAIQRLMLPQGRIPGKLEEALNPIGGAPFQVLAWSEDRFVASIQFRHTPYDAIAIVVRLFEGGALKIVEYYCVVTH
jgi:hypothetical protein